MKKSNLIEILQTIPGDPEIKFWNGFVQDWMDIDDQIIPVELTKTKLSWYTKAVAYEQSYRKTGVPCLDLTVDAAATIKQQYHRIGWNVVEGPRPSTDTNIFKQVYVLNTKLRNKKSISVNSKPMLY